MEQSSEQRHAVWVDSFVSATPPSYITDYHRGRQLETMLEEWRRSRREKALESLRSFLGLVSNTPPVDTIVGELEKNSPPDTTSLALTLRPCISDKDELCEAIDLANALVDPISRASLLTKVCRELSAQLVTLRQRLRDLESSLNGTRAGLFLAIAVLSLFLILSFSQHRYELTVDSPQPQVVRSSWWGLHTRRFPIRWMTFHSAAGPYKAWCVQDNHGEWYPYIVDDPGLDQY